MAEARHGVLPVPALGLHSHHIDTEEHRVQMNIDRSGLVIFIPNPRFLIRNGLRTLWTTVNAAKEAFYPLPMWAVVGLNAAVAYLALKNPEKASSYRLTKALLSFDSRIPYTTLIPQQLRVAYLSFNTSAVVLFGFTALQRAFLRQLLSYTDWLFETRGKKSLKTKIWGFLLKYVYMRGKRPLLFNYQNCLPTLPVPELKQTTERYLKSIRPLVTDAEYQNECNVAQEFLKNEGKTLQRYLVLKHAFSSNYVSDWWLNLVYLRSRDSLTVGSNYYGIGLAFAPPTNIQTSRAAVLIHNLVRGKLDIDHETLPPQLMQGILPICMEQYKRTFSTVREPRREQDKLTTYDSTASRHVIVMHNGRMYNLDCFSRKSRRPLTAKQLETALLGIVSDKTTQAADPIEGALPVLTSLPRSEWAEIRETQFQQVPLNDRSLDVIERALFMVSLDDYSPTNWTDEGRRLFLGDGGKNRWVDKSFHVIVFKNGKAGIQAEHSWGDAPACGHTFELAMAREATELPYNPDGTVKAVKRDIEKSQKGKESLYPAERIRFNFTPQLRTTIENAIPAVAKGFADLDLYVDGFFDYGKGFIKLCKCSPDGWLQMAFQLAYYRDQGHFDQTYESSMTRLFRHGRTETIRSVSSQSCAFARAMDDPTQTNADKTKLLRAACEAHVEYSHNALIGQAIDRHLFALYVVSVGTGTQSPFLKGALSRKWKLSTSQIPQRQTVPGAWPDNDMGDKYCSPSGGFGPVADDGYGISYNVVGEYRLFFHISSKHSAPNTSSKRMYERVSQALRDMRNLFPEIKDVAAAPGFIIRRDYI